MRIPPIAIALAAGSLARADVAYNNFGPGDTYSGNGWILYGPQSSPTWTQGFQFISLASGGITDLFVPMEHLANSNSFTFEIYSDNAGIPGTSLGVIGQTAGFEPSSPPPPPVEITADGSVHLTAGTTYWLVGSGNADSQGTWLGNDQNVMGLRAWMAFGLPWQPGTVTLAAFRIEVAASEPTCYANCDQSTAPPILNANDFQCFLNHFAAGDSIANCDQSTAPPVLNANDFQCFLNKFAAGCS
jgi:hypothetical protein